MPTDDFVKNALMSAKGALASADRFQKSAGGPLKAAPAPKPATPAPAKKAAPTVGDELKAKADNVNEYAGAKKMDSYKKGGTVEKTGPAIVHKGEEVIPVEKADKVKDMMKKAEGALSKEEKSRGKAKHGMKHTHIEHHHDGSHTVRHTPHMEMGADGMSKQPEDVSYAAPDMDALHAGLQEHLAQPGDGDAAAEAGPAAQATPEPSATE
jgi:hypothetical protein